MAQQQVHTVPVLEKESFMSLEEVEIDIPMNEFHANAFDIDEGIGNIQEDITCNEEPISVPDHYCACAKEGICKLVKNC